MKVNVILKCQNNFARLIWNKDLDARIFISMPMLCMLPSNNVTE